MTGIETAVETSRYDLERIAHGTAYFSCFTSMCEVPHDVSMSDNGPRGKLTAYLMMKLRFGLGLVTAKSLAHSMAH